MKRLLLVSLLGGLLHQLPLQTANASQEQAKYDGAVKKALHFLASKQNAKGYWGGGKEGEHYQIKVTALTATALLMEGSTPDSGAYQKHLKLAFEWLMAQSQSGGPRGGLLGDPTNPHQVPRYMLGHGHAMVFLASLYAREKNQLVRDKVRNVLQAAVRFAADAQATNGGWFFTSTIDSHDSDDGATTGIVLGGLRACQKSGIEVPDGVLRKAAGYFQRLTGLGGGVWHSSWDKPEHPYTTAAALVCMPDAIAPNEELVKGWLKFCRTTISLDGFIRPGAARSGYDVETHFFFAQAVYRLGDQGWEKLFGPTPEANRLTWSKYRAEVFDNLVRAQDSDGSWPSSGISLGPVYSTALLATLMQLDKGTLPVFRN